MRKGVFCYVKVAGSVNPRRKYRSTKAVNVDVSNSIWIHLAKPCDNGVLVNQGCYWIKSGPAHTSIVDDFDTVHLRLCSWALHRSVPETSTTKKKSSESVRTGTQFTLAVWQSVMGKQRKQSCGLFIFAFPSIQLDKIDHCGTITIEILSVDIESDGIHQYLSTSYSVPMLADMELQMSVYFPRVHSDYVWHTDTAPFISPGAR